MKNLCIKDIKNFLNALPSIGWHITVSAVQQDNLSDCSREEAYREISTRAVQPLIQYLTEQSAAAAASEQDKETIHHLIMAQILSETSWLPEWVIAGIDGKILFAAENKADAAEICRRFTTGGLWLTCHPCPHEEWRQYPVKSLKDIEHKGKVSLPLKPMSKLAFYAVNCLFNPYRKRFGF